MKRIYLDHNATTPVDPQVLEAMLPYYKDVFGNASSVHEFGRAAKMAIEDAREIVVRTGYEAVIRKKSEDPLPAFLSFDTDTIEKMNTFSFDGPWDDRRFFKGGDNQLAGVAWVVVFQLIFVAGVVRWRQALQTR